MEVVADLTARYTEYSTMSPVEVEGGSQERWAPSWGRGSVRGGGNFDSDLELSDRSGQLSTVDYDGSC